ncbi:MAG TPA: hypothetical protein VHR55_13280 [Candidatus Limnocylindria bacterium]|nr:hypothetical protein [Candidatus Limnocylindria bacterium]
MHWITTRPAALGAVLLVMALALAGCFNERDENTNEGTNPSPGAIAVEVRLTDDGIEMPSEISGGKVEFEVSNAGASPHGFGIGGVDGGLDELRPDKLETLRVELDPGSYTVYSPVDGDREAGLEVQLTVTEPADDGGAPLNDEGVGPSEEQQPIENGG